jgi:hypothetical protein
MNQTTKETPTREKVHAVYNYFDGILEGVADYMGKPYYFDMYGTNERLLTPLNDEVFSLILESWNYWLHYVSVHKSTIPHPCDYAKMRETQTFSEIEKMNAPKGEWARAEQNYQDDLRIKEFLSTHPPTLKAKADFQGRGYNGEDEASVVWHDAKPL